jgi:hypothetical protein
MKGFALTTSHKATVGFVANAEQGRVWLAEQRRAHRAQKAKA